ncbi:hypothetical protein ACGFYQ_33975 [Streptomyces sp. NPDC048258]|uniref:hypothetical protein n=1 Tax=Streptomyces sp. NPDC048258 TaxID=3365527 RepID=UPI00371373E5
MTIETPAQALIDAASDGIGNEQMLAAIHLLGHHDGGYWLRRFLTPDEGPQYDLFGESWSEVVQLDEKGRSHLGWDRIGELLEEDAFKASSSQKAILSVAVSLTGHYRVDLQRIVTLLDDQQMRLVNEALANAT